MGYVVWAILILVAITAITAAVLSNRRHHRAAQARSHAALNRLLAEADEIEREARRRQDEDGEPA
jgi:hypothetical protein